MIAIRTPIIALVVGLAGGYFLGYKDAYRGSKSLVARISNRVDDISPEEISKQRAAEAAKLRDAMHKQAGLDQVDSLIKQATAP